MSDRKSYPKAANATNETPGTWWPATAADGHQSALFVCPKCKRFGSLTEHTILADGTVQPSVGCGYSDCDYHEFIKLDGWEPD